MELAVNQLIDVSSLWNSVAAESIFPPICPGVHSLGARVCFFFSPTKTGDTKRLVVPDTRSGRWIDPSEKVPPRGRRDSREGRRWGGGLQLGSLHSTKWFVRKTIATFFTELSRSCSLTSAKKTCLVLQQYHLYIGEALQTFQITILMNYFKLP